MQSNANEGNGEGFIPISVTITTNLVGDLPRYGEVSYHIKGIANILSLNPTTSLKFEWLDGAPGNGEIQIKKYGPGTTPSWISATLEALVWETCSSILACNRSSTVSFSRACLARMVQTTIGRPSTRYFIRMVEIGFFQILPSPKQTQRPLSGFSDPSLGVWKGNSSDRPLLPYFG